jgi:hypothetical protein
VATQIAPAPGQGAGSTADRRTAALPQAPVPTAAPNARTMSFDHAQIAAGAGARPRETASRIPQATVISAPDRVAEPRQGRPNPWGRWVGGPLVALFVAIITAWLAGLVNPAHARGANVGRLRLSTDPEGAAVLVDGKVQPKVTPTLIEGAIGVTLHVTFKLDGYLDKDTDVLIGDGERPFRAKLERHEITPVTEPLPVVVPTPPPVSLAPTPRVTPEKSDHTSHKKVNRDHVVVSAPSDSVAPPLGSSGTLSVHVLPWAIVYVDGAKIRQTPLDAQSFAAGMHVVELVNDELHKKEKVTLQIRANGHEEIRRDWEK